VDPEEKEEKMDVEESASMTSDDDKDSKEGSKDNTKSNIPAQPPKR